MSTKKWFTVEDWEKKHGRLTLGRFVRAFRLSDEISQTEYAKKLGISRANLCDIEMDRKIVSPARAAKIAKALGVPEMALVAMALEDQLRRDKLPFRVKLKGA